MSKLAAAGKKRAEPGADKTKNGVEVDEPTLSEEEQQKISAFMKDKERADVIAMRMQMQVYAPLYAKRRELTKSIPKFWATTFTNHSAFALHVQHPDDQHALSYLEDVWVERDPVEPRAYTIELHFKENPFFEDKVLKKEYKYLAPPDGSADGPKDADGITPAMLDFSWERDVAPQVHKIKWKDPSKALTKLYPRVADQDDEDDVPADAGTFFNWFEVAEDPFDLGATVAEDIFPEAFDHFFGLGEVGDFVDDSEDEEDSDDDDAEEIDLEKPRKKQKHA